VASGFFFLLLCGELSVVRWLLLCKPVQMSDVHCAIAEGLIVASSIRATIGRVVLSMGVCNEQVRGERASDRRYDRSYTKKYIFSTLYPTQCCLPIYSS
jgi:hypothetical protein